MKNFTGSLFLLAGALFFSLNAFAEKCPVDAPAGKQAETQKVHGHKTLLKHKKKKSKGFQPHFHKFHAPHFGIHFHHQMKSKPADRFLQ